ncbi:TPA: glycosyltransferase family 2 protein [Photobacterium damselae]
MNKEKISICVITFNSSKTVIETLDSILYQTYGADNLELIIADDASKDDTTIVIDNWLTHHKNKFYQVKFIKHKKNGGISKNINSAWKGATCEWIKTIAGDDVLFDSSICEYISFVYKSKHKIVFSNMSKFSENIQTSEMMKIDDYFFSLNSKEQFEEIIINNHMLAPSSFISKKLLEEVNYANEHYYMMEDYPLWYEISKKGYEFGYINKPLVYYRIDESVSHNKNKFVNNNYAINLLFFYYFLTKHHGRNEIRDEKIKDLLTYLLVDTFFKDNVLLSRVLKNIFFCFRITKIKQKISKIKGVK